MQDEMEKWEREGGVKFLGKIGIRPGHKVLDFGARVGHYSIPAAHIVEDKGMIYAVDKERNSLAELERKASRMGLKNIKIIENSGEMTLDLENESIDVVLLYDVLHYFKTDQRKILYNDVKQEIQDSGFFFKEEYCGTISHDNSLNQGCVFDFKKFE